jgi:hypothetical protein
LFEDAAFVLQPLVENEGKGFGFFVRPVDKELAYALGTIWIYPPRPDAC